MAYKYLPGGSMKSKWTKSSIPSFFSCKTTDPRFDRKIQFYYIYLYHIEKNYIFLYAMWLVEVQLMSELWVDFADSGWLTMFVNFRDIVHYLFEFFFILSFWHLLRTYFLFCKPRIYYKYNSINSQWCIHLRSVSVSDRK
jgi:hypothetical protein